MPSTNPSIDNLHFKEDHTMSSLKNSYFKLIAFQRATTLIIPISEGGTNISSMHCSTKSQSY